MSAMNGTETTAQQKKKSPPKKPQPRTRSQTSEVSATARTKRSQIKSP